ncbi:MAG: sigma factor-like helix-turn-helix DNA-binding protein [Phycisphaerales bacterium JB040]
MGVRRRTLGQRGSKNPVTWRPDLTELSDLRRRQETRNVDWVLRRAQWLPVVDRELIEAVYRDGRRPAELARLAGVPVSTVRSRVKRVLTRACSDKLAFVVLRKDSWSPTRRRVAERLVICGDSIREAARHLGLSHYTVRRHRAAIDELYHESRETATNAQAG